MPNWSTNIIAVKGKNFEVIKWLNIGVEGRSHKKLEYGMSAQEMMDILNNVSKPISLDSFNPMPNTFHEYDTTNKKETFVSWLCDRFMDDRKKFSPKLNEKEVYAAAKKYLAEQGITVDENSSDEERNAYWKKRDEAIEEIYSQYKKDYAKYSLGYDDAAAYQQRVYGVVGWYDWGLKYRGTKWNANLENWSIVISGSEMIAYATCETAWSLPTTWLDTMQHEFSDLDFFCRATEESGCYNGFLSAKNTEDWVENDTDVWYEAKDRVEAEYGDEFDEDEQYGDIWEECSNISSQITDRFYAYVEAY